MMDEQVVKITDPVTGRVDEHTIEVKPITLVCHDGHMLGELEYPGCFIITPEVSIYHADRVQNLHPKTEQFFRIVYKDKDHQRFGHTDGFPMAFSADNVRKCTESHRQVMGMIDLTLKMFDMGTKIVWKYPESGIHPSVQVEFGDLLIALKDYVPNPKLWQTPPVQVNIGDGKTIKVNPKTGEQEKEV